MKYTRKVLTKYLDFDLTISSNDVRTHSVSTNEVDIEFMLGQTHSFFLGLLKNYEKMNEEELRKVGN